MSLSIGIDWNATIGIIYECRYRFCLIELVQKTIFKNGPQDFFKKRKEMNGSHELSYRAFNLFL